MSLSNIKEAPLPPMFNSGHSVSELPVLNIKLKISILKKCFYYGN